MSIESSSAAQRRPGRESGPPSILTSQDERLLDEFDVAWHSQQPPSIDGFLARRSNVSSGGDRQSRYAFLTELVKMDLEFRWRSAGEPEGDSISRSGVVDATLAAASAELPPLPVIEDYGRQFPMLQTSEEILIDLLAEEFRVRRLWGDSPRQAEYHERFPQLGESLKARLQQVELELQVETRKIDSNQSLSLGGGGSLTVRSQTKPPTDRQKPRVDDTEILSNEAREQSRPRDGSLPVRDEGDSEPNPKFGRYEILHEIARGGMGIVYKARHIDLERIVALKVILSGELAATKEVVRFEKEARAAANLQHPGIVPIYDVGTVDGRHYFSMAYIDGINLTAKVAGGPFEPRKAAEVCAAVADAIQYAHEHNVIHRDLKPANILIDQTGQPRITDFGLAKRMGEEGGITTAGQILGTPSCMPPEQAEGQLHLIGPRSDIYSIGAVLYMLLTGRPPFQASNPLDTLRQVVESDPVSPRELNRSVPVDLETICLKCLQKPLEKRYQTARELAEDLRRFLNREPPLARRMSRLGRTVRWCQRKPLIAALAGLAAGLTLSLVALGWTSYRRTSDALVNLQNEQMRTNEQRVLAERRLEELSAAQQQLVQQAQVEREARQSAEQSRQKAVAAQRYAELSLYFNRINSAQAEWHANHIGITEQILDSLPDEFGERWEEVRGWEWEYLKHLCHLDLWTISPLSATAYSVALSADGRFLGVAGDANDAVLLDPASGKELLRLKGHEKSIRRICFNAAATLCATASDDRTVRIWSVPKGDLLHTLTGHRGRAVTVQFSADGKSLASAGERGEVLVWDAAAGKLAYQFAAHSETIHAISLTPDGKRLATASQDGTARIWDLGKRGELQLTLLGHTGPLYGADWNFDGSQLATGSQDGTVKLWNASTGATLTTFQGHQDSVYSVKFLGGAGGQQVVSSGRDSTVRVWNPGTRREATVYRGHTDSVYDIAASSDGGRIYSAGRDKAVKFWDARISQPSVVVQNSGPLILAVAQNSAGRLLAAANDGRVRIWNLADLSSPVEIEAHKGAVLSVCCEAEGPWFLTTGSDKTVRAWNSSTLEAGQTYTADTEPVRCAAFGRLDGLEMALSGGDSEVARLWNLRSGETFREGPLHDSTLRNVGFLESADGNDRLGYSASSDGHVQIWDLKTGAVRNEIATAEPSLSSVSVSPDGSLLCIASRSTIQLWDWRNARLNRTLRGHGDEVTRVAFSPDGERLASAGRDGSIRIWDVLTGQQALVLENGRGHFLDLCFSPGGNSIAATSDDGQLRLWELMRPAKN